jgi:tripartite-type tricarboxylate transporter receptor subunit TctC
MRVVFPAGLAGLTLAGLALAGLALAAGLSLPAQADAVSDFYHDRTVTLITGYSPGGGFDLYTRIVANHIGRHIPGSPKIIVQNMPGAGSTRAAGHIYNIAPKDGTVIALARAPVIEPLVGTGGSAFDTT